MSVVFWSYVASVSAVAAVDVFALWKGGPYERLGGGWLLIGQAVMTTIDIATHGKGLGTSFYVGFDFVFALGFMALAIRSATRWLGACMLMSTGIFALESTYAINELNPDFVYKLVNNLLYYGIELATLLGTVGAIVSRGRLRKSELRMRFADAPAG